MLFRRENNEQQNNIQFLRFKLYTNYLTIVCPPPAVKTSKQISQTRTGF